MEVAPMDQIGKIKQEILARKSDDSSRPIRHRKVLVELVKAGGWVDERKFGLYVLGNYWRDLQGLLSIAPLGLRMIAKGKFPTSFEASEGTEEVRGLITAIQNSRSWSLSIVRAIFRCIMIYILFDWRTPYHVRSR